MVVLLRALKLVRLQVLEVTHGQQLVDRAQVRFVVRLLFNDLGEQIFRLVLFTALVKCNLMSDPSQHEVKRHLVAVQTIKFLMNVCFGDLPGSFSLLFAARLNLAQVSLVFAEVEKSQKL